MLHNKKNERGGDSVKDSRAPGADKTVNMSRNADLRPLSNLFSMILASMIAAWPISFSAAQTASQQVPPLAKPEKPRQAFMPPLPPPRPSGFFAAPFTPLIPAPSTAPAEAAAPSADTPLQAQSLPPASRARMHECGREWQKMKATGAAADKIWFDFAKACLTK